jgi:hypothetical protein
MEPGRLEGVVLPEASAQELRLLLNEGGGIERIRTTGRDGRPYVPLTWRL